MSTAPTRYVDGLANRPDAAAFEIDSNGQITVAEGPCWTTDPLHGDREYQDGKNAAVEPGSADFSAEVDIRSG